jgi:hypothetical protein
MRHTCIGRAVIESKYCKGAVYKRLPTPFIVVCAVLFVGCVSQGYQLTGSWVSTEITHPSPYFAEMLSDDKQRKITLFLDQAKKRGRESLFGQTAYDMK